jgi:hypothetical protein
MPESDSDDIVPTGAPTPSAEKHVRQDEPMDEEEKVLAGRADANIPALLTKDVPGG